MILPFCQWIALTERHDQGGRVTGGGRPARTPAPGRANTPRGPATAARRRQAVQGLEAERVLAQRQRRLWPRPRSRSRARLRRLGVVGAVDDPQVLPAPALEPGLHRALRGPRGDACERLDHHALAAGGGELPPPPVAAADRRRVGRSTTQPPGRGEELRVGGARAGPPGEVPVVVAVRRQAAPVRGQELERREAHPASAVGRPAVAAGRRRVTPRRRPPASRDRASSARRPQPRARPPRPARPAPPAARPGRRRRRRRTARRSSSRPWPTTAAARRRAAASRCPARPTARPPSAASRTCASSRPRASGRRRTAGRCGCRQAAGRRRPRTVAGRLPRPGRPGDRPRAHVLLLADHLVDARPAVVGERLGRVLQEAVGASRSRRAPSSAAGTAASRGSTAKRLITSSAAAAFSSGRSPGREAVSRSRARRHVVEVEQVRRPGCAVRPGRRLRPPTSGPGRARTRPARPAPRPARAPGSAAR